MTDRDRERDGEFAALIARGRVAWPEVVVSEDDFARAFASTRLASADGAVLEAAHADVYLACACLAASESARICFERSIMTDVPKAVRRIDTDATFVYDVTADLRLALLGGERGAAPGILRYKGKGPLRSFVMVIAMRRALDRKRRQREIPVEDSVLGGLLVTTDTGETGDETLRDTFVVALKYGLASLDARDRNILRMHFVDGIPAEALARMYDVHRATMTRWIASAREAVFAATQDVVRRERRISPETFASFARVAAAELDATLSTFLGEQADDAEDGDVGPR